MKIAILPQCSAIEPHFVRKGCDRTCSKSQFYGDRTSFRAKGLQPDPWNRNFTAVFGVWTSFRAKRFAGPFANRNFTSVFGDRTSFRAKLRSDKCKWKSQFYLSFRRSNLISCERVATGPVQNRNFTSVFGDRTSFRAKGLRRTREITILLQFLAIEHRFVRNGCVSCRLVVTAPRLKREIDKKERARGQERM